MFRTRTHTEIWIVLGLSLGASAIFSALSLLNNLTQHGLTGMSAQQTTMNPSFTDVLWLDLAFQVAQIIITLMPVALVFWLLGEQALSTLGLASPSGAWAPQTRDVLTGVVLAAVVGIPGIGLYLAAREAGINSTVITNGLSTAWWVPVVLVLRAAMNAILEEVIVVGYLMRRWTELGVSPRLQLVLSALLRGAYHLYQGIGGFIGNIAMGLIFGAYYQRSGRLWPLIVAHTVMDTVVFLGAGYVQGKYGF